MSLVIPVGYAQVTYLFNGAGTPTGAAVTLGLDTDGAMTPEEIGELAQIAYNGNLSAFFDAEFEGENIRVKLGPNATGVSSDVVAPFGGTAVDADPEPPNTALLVQKRTALGGRSGRGRSFWPGLTSTQVVNGAIAPTTVAALDAAFEDFRQNFIAGLAIPVLFHDELSPVSTPTPIERFAVQGVAATQRRRLRR